MAQIEQRLDELMELREALHNRLAEDHPAAS
jgi:hypothetical protein